MLQKIAGEPKTKNIRSFCDNIKNLRYHEKCGGAKRKSFKNCDAMNFEIFKPCLCVSLIFNRKSLADLLEFNAQVLTFAASSLSTTRIFFLSIAEIPSIV